jgi:predicted dehydrogenase
MKRIKAGIIGMGNIGCAHFEAIRRLGYADLAAACIRTAQASNRHGIPRIYADYRELLDDPEIDVIHNCTPNTEHYRINRDIILSGKHVLSEKPLTTDSEESGLLVGLAASHNVKNAVNFVYRHHAMIGHIKEMIESGALGDIYAVRGLYLQDWLLFDTDYNWRVESKLGGPSRAMADIGSHWCDLAQYLLGSAIVEVNADLATFVPARTIADKSGSRSIKVDTEDYGSALMRFSGGERGSLSVSQTSAGRKLGLSIDIDGSLASVHWEQEEADRIWIGHRDKPNEVLMMHPALLNTKGRGPALPDGKTERWPDAQKRMIDSFYRSILGEESSQGESLEYADFAAGHRIQRIVDAMLESSQARRWISISV